MIRTDIVNLTVIPAVAFRQKLTAGGSGITILRYDTDQPGIASISKTSGDPIPTVNTPAAQYPLAAFKEAMQLTLGMPYRKRGNVKLTKKAVEETAPEPAEQETLPEEILIDSNDYQKLVGYYTNQSGKLSYDLIDRDLIRFAHASKVVRGMIAEKSAVKTIRSYVASTKFKNVIGNKKLSDTQVMKMAELMDEISPKSIFKALDSELRRLISADKRK